MSAPAQLTTGEYAVLANKPQRTVQAMIARGEFPPGSVVHVGLSRHAKHARLLTAKLLEAGWLLPSSVALLCLALSLPATEHVAIDQPNAWYAVNASHHGKHAVGGVAIGAVAYTGAAFATDEREDRYAAAVICGVAVGVGYELVEGRDGKSYVDPVDALWVAAGALVGAAIADATDQLLTITPKRDGAALTLAWRF